MRKVSEPGKSFGNFLKALAAKTEKEREGKSEERGEGLVVLVDENAEGFRCVWGGSTGVYRVGSQV